MMVAIHSKLELSSIGNSELKSQLHKARSEANVAQQALSDARDQLAITQRKLRRVEDSSHVLTATVTDTTVLPAILNAPDEVQHHSMFSDGSVDSLEHENKVLRIRLQELQEQLESLQAAQVGQNQVCYFADMLRCAHLLHPVTN